MPEAEDGKEKQAEADVFVGGGDKTAGFEELSDGSLQAEQQFVRKLGETDTRGVVRIILQMVFFQQILSKEKNGDTGKQGNAVRNKVTEKSRDRKSLQTEGLQNQSEKDNAHQVDDGG